MQIGVVAGSLAAIALAVFFQKRGSGGFYSRLEELHQERARFWRKRVQLGMGEAGNADELRDQARRHATRVTQLTEELRTRFREQAAASEVMGSAHEAELRAISHALFHPVPDAREQEEAKRYLAAAHHAAAAGKRLRGGRVAWRETAELAFVGAVVGGFLAYTIPRYFFLALPPGFSWTSAFLNGAPVGAAATVLLAGWVGDWMRARLRPALLSVGAASLALLSMGGKPSQQTSGSVIQAMVAEAECPRDAPPVRHSSVALSPAQRCALVVRALEAIPEGEAKRALLERRGDARLEVAEIAETDPTRDEAPGHDWVWTVTFAAWLGTTHEWMGPDRHIDVHVSKRTGEPRLASISY
jgi:hypothetical protein